MAASIPAALRQQHPAAANRAGTALRLLDAATIERRDSDAWDDLGDHAEPAGAFAEPWFVRRSLEHCDPQGTARLAVVAAHDGRWLGAMPVVPVARQGRSPLPAWAAWTHPNRFAGTPLVRRGQAMAFWRGLIDGLGRADRARIALCLRDLPLDDPVNRVLLEGCARAGRPVTIDRTVGRARLAAGPGAVVPELCAKQASRIRGLERKLEREVGPIELAIVGDAARIEETIAAFLALERAGWKGAAGSAMACAEPTRGLFLAVAREAAARGCFEAGVLRAGGQVLAIATQLGGHGRMFGFKMAYDEAFASYAPGLLLLNRLTGSFVARTVGDVDSCAAPDQQPISRLWPARRELVDCRVALGGAVRGRVFSGMLACERAARRLRKA